MNSEYLIENLKIEKYGILASFLVQVTQAFTNLEQVPSSQRSGPIHLRKHGGLSMIAEIQLG